MDLVVSMGPEETEPKMGSATVYMPSDNPFGHDIGTQAALSSGTVTVNILYSDGSYETVYTAYCSSADAYESGWSKTVSGEAGTSAKVQAMLEGMIYASYDIYFD